MRTTLLIATISLAAAGVASAQTQEPRDPKGGGPVGLDLIAAPAPGFGVPFRLSKNLTLRATVGFGTSASNGAAWNLGGNLRYTLRPEADWSAYLSAQASYLHASTQAYGGTSAGSGGALGYGANGGLFGGGVGVRRNLGHRTSAYGELLYGRLTSTGVYDSWGMWRVNGANTVSLALGATFGLR
jgi:hypothetical protein